MSAKFTGPSRNMDPLTDAPTWVIHLLQGLQFPPCRGVPAMIMMLALPHATDLKSLCICVHPVPMPLTGDGMEDGEGQDGGNRHSPALTQSAGPMHDAAYGIAHTRGQRRTSRMPWRNYSCPYIRDACDAHFFRDCSQTCPLPPGHGQRIVMYVFACEHFTVA